MPTTSPSASSSGPPELPGLIEASVWIAAVDREVGERVDRAVGGRDDARPRATGSARTGCRSPRPPSPTSTSVSEPSGSGCRSSPSGSTFEQGDVGEGIEADDVRRDLVAVGELNVDLVGLVQRPVRRAGRLGVGDDVGVGEDLAVVGDDEARSPGPAAAAAAALKMFGALAVASKTETTVTTPGAAARVDRVRRRRRRPAAWMTTRCASSPVGRRGRAVGADGDGRRRRRAAAGGERDRGERAAQSAAHGARAAMLRTSRRDGGQPQLELGRARGGCAARASRPCEPPARARSRGRGRSR